jgi:hypothetical protein
MGSLPVIDKPINNLDDRLKLTTSGGAPASLSEFSQLVVTVTSAARG